LQSDPVTAQTDEIYLEPLAALTHINNMKLLNVSLLAAALAFCGIARAQQLTNQPYANEVNWALKGVAYQSSDSTTILSNGAPPYAYLGNDGNTDGIFADGSTTLTGGPAGDAAEDNPFNGYTSYWYVDLNSDHTIGALHVWFRVDCCSNRNDDFTIVVLDSDLNVVLTNTYPGSPPLNLIYNFDPPIQGEYVVFLPQNPLTTSDGYISIAEMQVIAPYTNVTLTVAANPTNVTVSEGYVATFGPVAATVVGPPPDRVTYQWQKNGVDIPGANGTNYTTPINLISDNGSQFTVKMAVSGTNILSAPATLTVVPYSVPPVLNSLTIFGGVAFLAPALTATIAYDQVMDPASTTNVANYNFGAGVTVDTATLSPILLDTNATDTNEIDGYQTVTLTISGLPQNSAYSLTVSGVKDVSGTTIVSTNLTGTVPFYEVDWAMAGTATQSSTGVGGDAYRAIDGNTDGYFADGSVTINAMPEDPGWWQVDLGDTKPIGRLHIWFRTLTAAECQALFNSCTGRNDDFSLFILDASSNVVWDFTYPGRPPTDVPFNFPPGMSGRYVLFNSQTPLTTSDGYFSIAELQVVAPYTNTSLTVTQNPVSTSIVENTVALLGPVAVTVTGAPVAALEYQWQQNGSNILGANNSTYQTPPLALTNSGIQFSCDFLLSGVLVASSNATVTVTPDTTPPTVQSVVGDPTYTYLTVTFSKGVTAATAGNAANYSLSGGLTISAVTVLTPNSVRLTTSPQTPGTGYILTVNNILDLAATPIAIAANATTSFTTVSSSQNNFIVVGDPGNPNDPLDGEGAVGYTFLIDKYKLTTTEYAAFLNSVATDPNNPIFVGDDALYAGGMAPLITQSGTTTYSYAVVPGTETYPINYISGLAAMRYVNWLNNGATSTSDTEHGAYTMGSALTTPPTPDVFSARNTNALYFLPNTNEWYKAAYYDPNIPGYWIYSPQTDDPNPADTNGFNAALPPGNAFSANFNTIAATTVDNLTPVGAYINAASYYGTFDQSGLLWEWAEPVVGSTSTRRMGGSQGNNAARLASTTVAVNGIQPGGSSVNQGVRIAEANRLTIPMVTIGDPGNPPDPASGNGQVNYAYQIGKYMVNNTEYTAFLNGAATATNYPYLDVWSANMQIDRNLVSADGTTNYSYSVQSGFENRPVNWVSTVAAMRMANWLCNGGTAGSDTESGAYTFSSEFVFSARNVNAPYFLPTPAEYYKAAYYDPTAGGSDYWLYAVRTSDPNPADTNGLNAVLPPGNAFSANFNSLTDPLPGGPGTTDVGAYINAASYYGTFDQTGNLWEWTEPLVGATTTQRMGGSQGNNAARLAATVVADNGINPGGTSINQGFRLAALPAGATFISTLSITTVSNGVQISWNGNGILQVANSLNGGWISIPGATTSPQTIISLSGAKFYRLLQQ
jgi:formylglycine-generating enzyme required for sulfatase activity